MGYQRARVDTVSSGTALSVSPSFTALAVMRPRSGFAGASLLRQPKASAASGDAVTDVSL